MSDVVARFFVDEVTRRAYNPDHAIVVLKAAGRGEQNKSWSQWTPAGKLEMTINNPPAARFFEENLGRDVELRFSLVNEQRYSGEHSNVDVESKPPAS